MEKFKKVLLIDDDEIVNSINKVIIKHAKFAEEVVTITNVSEAIVYLNESKDKGELPEVIFLDLNMPDRTGWDFMDEFRQIKTETYPKIIMLTSSISTKDEQLANSSEDIIAFVSKPLSPELLQTIYSEKLIN